MNLKEAFVAEMIAIYAYGILQDNGIFDKEKRSVHYFEP